MLSGASIDLFSNMTIFLNGWELKYDQLWDTKLKNQMHGWMVNNQLPDSGYKNYSQINSMTMSINSCLEIFFIPSLLSSRKILFLLQPDISLSQEDLFLFNIFKTKILWKKYSSRLSSHILKETSSHIPYLEYLFF